MMIFSSSFQQLFIFIWLITHQLCDTIDDPSPETKPQRESRKQCRGSFDCDIDQWCHGNHCDLPCPRKNCTEIKPPDGECVVRDHLPVCKSPAELEFEQELRDSGGCLNNDDCGENEWCMYAVCEDACAQLNCAAQQDDFECKVENHQPKCYSTEIEAGEIPDELVGLGGSCTSSFQCQDHLNCLKSECQNPCGTEWCDEFNLDEPPDNFTEGQKLWFSMHKMSSAVPGVDASCRVRLKRQSRH
ncbi:uncharacterized protein LOC111047883 [Nilaparvata lugens]|uniref:uncharacterized protein LOC111047883 n=1 Tax=Nilaparvata lugens TaxID=108931 RepID=UPI00193E73AE|nr:uncharacterized protein LOC111047883 [Nilaparvata lugens]